MRTRTYTYAAGVTALAVFASGTALGTFTDEETVNLPITAGFVDIAVTPTTTLTQPISPMAAGDHADRVVTVANNGNVTVGTFNWTVEATSEQPFTTSADRLRVSIWSCDQPYQTTPTGTQETCPTGTEYQVVDAVPVEYGVPVPVLEWGDIPPGGELHLRVRVELPEPADNTHQDNSTVLVHQLTGIQRPGRPLPSPGAPTVPPALTATPDDWAANITWSPDPGAARYRVTTSPAASTVPVTVIPAGSCTPTCQVNLTGLIPTVPVTVKVEPLNDSGPGPAGTVTVTPTGTLEVYRIIETPTGPEFERVTVPDIVSGQTLITSWRNAGWEAGWVYPVWSFAPQNGPALGPIPAPPSLLSGGWADIVTGVNRARCAATGTGVRVAIIDDGVRQNHPEMLRPDGTSRVVLSIVQEGAEDQITYDHGMLVASAIAGTPGNGIGADGVAPGVDLLSIVVGGSRRGELDLALGIVAAVNNGADIINISQGLRIGTITRFLDRVMRTPGLERAIRYARDNGVLVVAAAGNQASPGSDVYPAALSTRFDNMITVGFLDGTTMRPSKYSNYGPHVDLYAPGDPVHYVKTPDGQPEIDEVGIGASSYAAPYTAGVAAMLLSQNPNLTPAQIKNVLRSTARRPTNPDPVWRNGLVDAAAAAAAVGVNVPENPCGPNSPTVRRIETLDIPENTNLPEPVSLDLWGDHLVTVANAYDSMTSGTLIHTGTLTNPDPDTETVPSTFTGGLLGGYDYAHGGDVAPDGSYWWRSTEGLTRTVRTPTGWFTTVQVPVSTSPGCGDGPGPYLGPLTVTALGRVAFTDKCDWDDPWTLRFWNPVTGTLTTAGPIPGAGLVQPPHAVVYHSDRVWISTGAALVSWTPTGGFTTPVFPTGTGGTPMFIRDLASGPDGLYATDTVSDSIWRFAALTDDPGVPVLVFGGPNPDQVLVDGPQGTGRLVVPTRLAVAPDGGLWVWDTPLDGQPVLRAVSPADGRTYSSRFPS